MANTNKLRKVINRRSTIQSNVTTNCVCCCFTQIPNRHIHCIGVKNDSFKFGITHSCNSSTTQLCSSATRNTIEHFIKELYWSIHLWDAARSSITTKEVPESSTHTKSRRTLFSCLLCLFRLLYSKQITDVFKQLRLCRITGQTLSIHKVVPHRFKRICCFNRRLERILKSLHLVRCRLCGVFNITSNSFSHRHIKRLARGLLPQITNNTGILFQLCRHVVELLQQRSESGGEILRQSMLADFTDRTKHPNQTLTSCINQLLLTTHLLWKVNEKTLDIVNKTLPSANTNRNLLCFRPDCVRQITNCLRKITLGSSKQILAFVNRCTGCCNSFLINLMNVNLHLLDSLEEPLIYEVLGSGGKPNLLCSIVCILSHNGHNVGLKEIEIKSTMNTGNLVQTFRNKVFLLENVSEEVATLTQISRLERIRNTKWVGLINAANRRGFFRIRIHPLGSIIAGNKREIILLATNTLKCRVNSLPASTDVFPLAVKISSPNLNSATLVIRCVNQQIRIRQILVNRITVCINTGTLRLENSHKLLFKLLRSLGLRCTLNRTHVDFTNKISCNLGSKLALSQKNTLAQTLNGHCDALQILTKTSLSGTKSNLRQSRFTNLANRSAKRNLQTLTKSTNLETLTKHVYAKLVCPHTLQNVWRILECSTTNTGNSCCKSVIASSGENLLGKLQTTTITSKLTRTKSHVCNRVKSNIANKTNRPIKPLVSSMARECLSESIRGIRHMLSKVLQRSMSVRVAVKSIHNLARSRHNSPTGKCKHFSTLKNSLGNRITQNTPHNTGLCLALICYGLNLCTQLRILNGILVCCTTKFDSSFGGCRTSRVQPTRRGGTHGPNLRQTRSDSPRICVRISHTLC